MRTVYMDHSATTPVDPEVFNEMIPYYKERYGNPSSIYSLAHISRNAVENARRQVAGLINASAQEIIFTSGGTEADNQALITYMQVNRSRGNHLITSSIEHHAILHTCDYLKKQGFEITVLPVDNYGLVEINVLEKAMKPNTTLVSVMHANNEVGTIEPIRELADIAHQGGAAFHTDAVQSLGKIPVDVKNMGIDLLSGSGHKLYGPKGAGFLYVKKGIRISNLLHGGGQERRLRAGTENVPGIVGLGKATELAAQHIHERAEKLNRLGGRLIAGILNAVPNSRLTGHPQNRIPGHTSFCFESIAGEPLLLMLDGSGIMGSSGSACTTGSLDPSHVLLALGLPPATAHGSLRLTMGKDNTDEDVEYVLKVLPPLIANLRNI